MPEGWIIRENSFGQQKFVKSNPREEIDFISLIQIRYFKENNLRPDIENFIVSPVLNIQGMAYDTKHKLLMGGLGIEAIQKRRIEAMSSEAVTFSAGKKTQSVEDYIESKRVKLGF